MHGDIRASWQLRARSAQPTSEAWHDLSRYVAASRVAEDRRTSESIARPEERSG